MRRKMTDQEKRRIFTEMETATRPLAVGDEEGFVVGSLTLTTSITQAIKTIETTSDILFLTNIVDYTADCVIEHLETKDGSRERFNTCSADGESMESWCPGQYEQLESVCRTGILRLSYQKHVAIKDMIQRVQEDPNKETQIKEKKKRMTHKDLPKELALVPQKINTPEVDKNLIANMEKCLQVLTDSPISFFRFVINPNSYVQTVYNVFITSFLVHERRAALSVRSPCELFIHRCAPKDDSPAHNTAAHVQLIVSISPIEWKALTRHLAITSPMLPEFCPKVSKYFNDSQLSNDLAKGVTFLDP